MKKIITISREDLKNRNFDNICRKNKGIKVNKRKKEELAMLLSKIAV